MNDSTDEPRNYWKYAFYVLLCVSVILLGFGLNCWLTRVNTAIGNYYGERSYNYLKKDFDTMAQLFLAFQTSMSRDKLINEAHKLGLGTMFDKNDFNRIQVGLTVFAFNQDGKLMWIKQYDDAH